MLERVPQPKTEDPSKAGIVAARDVPTSVYSPRYGTGTGGWSKMTPE
jgi:hypothetical protein